MNFIKNIAQAEKLHTNPAFEQQEEKETKVICMLNTLLVLVKYYKIYVFLQSINWRKNLAI